MQQRAIATVSGVVSVGTTSTVVLAANPGMLERTIVNDGANVVYLELATPAAPTPTAVADQCGIRLNANGGSWTTTSYTGPIAGIAETAATDVTVVEI